MTNQINKRTFIVIAILFITTIGVLGWTNRDRIAVQLAPQKQAAQTRSDAALAADELFWETFHGGKYDNIQQTLDALTAAYLETPTDAVTAAHIAWLHNWRMVERAALLTAFDLQIDRPVFTLLAAIIAFMALVYLGTAVIGRRAVAWLLFVVGFVAIFVLRLLNLSSALVFVFLVIAFGFWLFGVVRVQAHNRSSLVLDLVLGVAILVML